jgi:glucose-6-phosphate 1-dehydrogenase
VNEAALDDSARRAPACTLVIFGASGDLTERKLLPALRQLAANRRLRPEFALVGVARTEMSDEEWADRCLSGAGAVAGEIGDWASRASFRYVSGGYDDPETYRRLGEVLADCDRALGTAGQHVFYWPRRRACSAPSPSSWASRR